MANKIQKLLDAVTVTGAGSGVELTNATKAAFQVAGTTSSGSGSATVKLQATLDESNWVDLGTVILSLSTTSSSDGFVIDAAWKQVRGNVTAISGTGAAVSAHLGMQQISSNRV